MTVTVKKRKSNAKADSNDIQGKNKPTQSQLMILGKSTIAILVQGI
jgi:hypothetical protein